jgi:hypothetical protein
MRLNITKTLVEDCYILKLSQFPRSFYRLGQCKGEFVIQKNNTEIPVYYEMIQRRIEPQINILFHKTGKYHSQSIGYDIHPIKFGTRSVLLCDCGHRANKLYMPPNGNRFMCAKCWDLRYLTQTINRQVAYSDFFYYHSRLTKLDEAISSLKRVQYAGKPTSKVQALARQVIKCRPDINAIERMEAELALISSK